MSTVASPCSARVDAGAKLGLTGAGWTCKLPKKPRKGGNPMSRQIRGPTGKLFVDDGGRGAPVLFVHSLAGTSAHWSAQLEVLRSSRRAVAFDLRGHGRSDPPADGAYAITSVARDVEAVADALGFERFALVGHSMGGGVALAYAGAHPARVDRLLLLDAIGDGTQIPAAQMQPFIEQLESPAYQEAIEGYWNTIIGPNAAVRDRLLRDLRATPRQTVVEGFKAAAGFDPKPALAAYRGHALAVVTPANDFPFSLHRLPGGPPHRVVEGTGHWIQLDKPDEITRVVEGLLAGEREGRTEKGEGEKTRAKR
jgi:pimeloyl-ACP methyl ester carboxylesterase